MVERENEHNEDQQKLKDRMLRIVNYYDGHLGNKKLRKEFIDSSKDDGQQVTDADFERIRSELIRDGLLKKARGMGGATSLVSQDAVQQQKEEPPMTNAPTDWQRNLLVEIVKKSGHEGRIGNKKLRDEFISQSQKDHGETVTEDDFWKIRNGLVLDGVLEKGLGKGGATLLSESGRITTKPRTEFLGKKKDKSQIESTLYEPFCRTVGKQYASSNPEVQYISEASANQGARTTGGKWTRPDVKIVTVLSFDFIPGKWVEIITYELKPKNDFGITGVFEAAAHRAFANKSYLAIQVEKDKDGDLDSDEDFVRLRRECDRLGVGLTTFEDPDDWETFTEHIPPKPNTPDPAEMNKFINAQINDENKNKLKKLLR